MLRNRLAPGALILLYHRINELPTDPQLLNVRPGHFRKHLEILRKVAQPISLREFMNAHRERRKLRRVFMVTFDDGYRDNLELAKPLLEEYQAPATVSVASGYVGENREFWWDELERLLLTPGKLPYQFQIRIRERVLNFDLGAYSTYSVSDAKRYAFWNVAHPVCPTSRHSAYLVLYSELRTTNVAARDEALRELRLLAGDGATARADYLAMDRQEIRQLRNGGLIEIAAHSVNHPCLSCISPAEQQSEIRNSKTDLEKLLGIDVQGFAYPFGASADYDSHSLHFVGRSGFDWALSNYPAMASFHTDRFQLPRVLVGDWNGPKFTHFLREWV